VTALSALARMRAAKPSARAGLAVGLSALLTLGPEAVALGPLQRNHPAVERGKQAYQEGRFEDALREFEEAKRQLPASAAVEFNRGNALYKLGRRDEAKEAYRRVMEAESKDLQEKDYYNLGNTWAQLGNGGEAVSAYRRALTLDPQDEDARHNLEVILRKLPPPKGKPDGGGPPPDAGPPDGGDGGSAPDGGADAGTDGGDAGGDAGKAGGPGDAGRDGGADAGQGQQTSPQGEPQRDGGTDAGSEQSEEGGVDAGFLGDARLSKEEAERMLDSMRQNEKNLQLWRFQQRKPRKPNEKDW